MYDVTLSIYAIESSSVFHVHLERKMRSSVTNVKRVVVLHPRRKMTNNIRKCIQGHMNIHIYYYYYVDHYIRYLYE